MLQLAVEDVLAGRSRRTEGGGLGGERGLVVLVALLYEESDTALLAGDDTDGLFASSVPFLSLIHLIVRSVRL